MPVRIKKLIGTLIIIAFVVFYCLAVMILAVNILPGTNAWIQTVFYMFFGFLWVVPVAMLITWMQRPPEGANG